jgi:hypothetical protein
MQMLNCYQERKFEHDTECPTFQSAHSPRTSQPQKNEIRNLPDTHATVKQFDLDLLQ